MLRETENLFEELQQIYSYLKKSIKKNITYKTLVNKKTFMRNYLQYVGISTPGATPLVYKRLVPIHE